MRTLKICLLGRPLIELGGRHVDGFVSEKTLTLFAYLVLEPASHSREALAGLFWGEMPAARARANLRMAVYNLGQLFPGCLQTSRSSVAFERATGSWLDVEQFAEGVRPGSQPASIEALQSALALYRGDFLEGVFLDGSPELDEWLLVERERFRQLALEGYQQLAAQWMEAGEYPQAARAWQALLRLEPWQESAHQGLMLALARSGNFTVALEQFETCRCLLADELGVEPMPETSQLYERIRAARDLPVRHNLPPQPNELIGRERELRELERALADPRTRLITIVGPGGAGKSRLALQAAASQVQARLHGVWFAPLETLASAGGLPAAIGACLGFSFKGSLPLKVQLLERLQDREVLMVLDNFEHLLEGADLLAEILEKAPQVKILVTSRQRLNLREERLFQLSGLEYPGPGQADAWQAYPAVRLFIEAGRRARNGFSPGEKEREAILQICRLVDGMPLGIEMAAAWAGHLSPQEIASAIQTNLGSLATSYRNVPERHHSLRAAFDHSWSLLVESERGALRRASIFRGGFTARAAASAAGVSVQALGALLDKSLLQAAPQADGRTRYRLHALVRQFAYEKLLEAGEEQSLHEKHLAYYLGFGEEASPLLSGPEQAHWVRRLEQEHPNLLAALEWSAGREETRLAGLKLAVALAPFWEIRGYFAEGLARLRASLDSCRDVPAGLRVKALLGAGRLAFLSGEHDFSRLVYEQSLRMCRASQDSVGLLDALNGLVAVLTDLGDYRQAGQLGEEALARARQSGDQDKIALAANNLGLLGWYQGDYRSARRYLEESLRLRRLTGNQLGIGYGLNNLALVTLDEGRHEEAARLLEESLAIRRKVGDRRGTAFVLGNLGLVAKYRGDFKAAAALFEEDLAIRRELGDRHYISHTLCNLGSTDLALGDYTRARRCYEEGLAIAHRLEDPSIVAFLSRGLGSLHSDLGESEAAFSLMEEALALERSMGSGRSLCMALAQMGRLALRSGDFELAQGRLEEAGQLALKIHYQLGEMKVFSALGSLCVRKGEAAKAGEYFTKAFRIAAGTGNGLEIAASLEGLAGLAALQGRTAYVVTLLSCAAARRKEAGTPLPPADRPGMERLLEGCRRKLPASDFQDLWEKGSHLDEAECREVLQEVGIK